MIYLCALHNVKNDKNKFEIWLAQINNLRALYPYSKNVYQACQADRLFLICHARKPVGFVEAELLNGSIADHGKMKILVHFLQIASSEQKKGFGHALLLFFLRKGVEVEFVVANANENMLRLVRKFQHIKSGETSSVCTITLNRQ